MHHLRLPSLLLILLLAGCATAVRVPTPQLEAQAQQAQQLFDAGQFQQAALVFGLWAAHRTCACDTSRRRRAAAGRKAGLGATVAAALRGIDRANLQQNDAFGYDLLEAEVALRNGNPAPGLALTATLPTTLSPGIQMRSLQLRAGALEANQQPWEAARTRVTLQPLLPPDKRADNRTRILQLLSGLGLPALQQHLGTLPPDDPMQPWLAQAMNQLGAHVAPVMPALTQAVGTLLPNSTVPEGYVMPTQVALIVPLSGTAAAAGEAVRQGFLAAYFQGGDTSSRPPVRIYDTGGTVAGAASAYQQAILDGATAVVGPLLRAGVDAVQDQVQGPVELLTLNHPASNHLPPPDVAEFALRPEADGAQVAERMYRNGLTNAIVLASSVDEASRRAAQAFQSRFTALGGMITNTMDLDPASVDYRKEIDILDLDVADPSTTAIFLAMRAPQGRLVMPQLRLAGNKLPVFATAYIYTGTRNPVADGDLDGVTFCDAPWLFSPLPGYPPQSTMAAQLPAAGGASARLFAFGMDAWRLVPYLSWLRTHPGSYLRGASGRLTEDVFGRIHRRLAWAHFAQGVPQPTFGGLEASPLNIQQAPAPATTPPSGSAIPDNSLVPSD